MLRLNLILGLQYAYHGIVIHECRIIGESVYDEDKRHAACSEQREVDPWPEAKEREDSKHVYHFYCSAGRTSAAIKHNFVVALSLLCTALFSGKQKLR